jgi:hypothetical protein
VIKSIPSWTNTQIVLGVLSAKAKNLRKHDPVSISIHVPLGATNGLFITLLDDLLSGLKDPVVHPFASLLCPLINNY